MWDGLAVLLLLCVALGTSSYLAGLLPLSFTLSGKHMRLLTACGTGILVGTALIVIIPEGVETLYSAKPVGPSPSHKVRSQGTADIRGAVLSVRADAGHAHYQVERETDTVMVTRTEGGEASLDPRKPAENDARPAADKHSEPSDQHDDHGATGHDFEPHAWIGISVILGFILMYLVDKLPKVITSQASIHRPAYVSLERMGIHGHSSADDDTEDIDHASEGASFRPSSTTTGLVIHAAADGIALGASSTASTQKLSLIIFFALMIHKAPAAFGLTAVLLKQGLSRREAKIHLMVFSLAAPVGAVTTWFLAHVFGGSALDHGDNTTFVTGLLLLFSGGTFLYVAMHTMQEGGQHSSPEHGDTENGYANIYQQQNSAKREDGSGPTLIDTLATVGGMLLPLLTQFGHAH